MTQKPAHEAPRPRYLRWSDAAARYSVSEATVRRWVKSFDVRTVKLNRTLLIDADALEAAVTGEREAG